MSGANKINIVFSLSEVSSRSNINKPFSLKTVLKTENSSQLNFWDKPRRKRESSCISTVQDEIALALRNHFFFFFVLAFSAPIITWPSVLLEMDCKQSEVSLSWLTTVRCYRQSKCHWLLFAPFENNLKVWKRFLWHLSFQPISFLLQQNTQKKLQNKPALVCFYQISVKKLLFW